MRPWSLYLDTSTISLLFQADAGERHEVTRAFFQNVVRTRLHDIFISDVVMEEIERTPDIARREAMLKTISDYPVTMLEFDPEQGEVVELADVYINLGIIPKKNRSDAMHVAVATVSGMDAVVTWNFRHLAGVNREERFSNANWSQGYHKPIRLITPMEVAYP